MRLPSLILITCCLLSALATGVRAFNLNVGEIHHPENGVLVAAEIEANGEKFSLLVPRGWRAALAADANGVSLESRSGKTPFSIHFSTGDAGAVLRSADTLRQATIPLLEGAQVIEEFPAYSGYGAGRGVDFSFLLHGNRMRARVAVIPLAQSYARFVLTSDPEDWPAAQQTFGRTLTSFRRATVTLASQQRNRSQERRPQDRRALVQAEAAGPVVDDLPPPLQPGMLVPLGSLEVRKPSMFEGKWDYILLGLIFTLALALVARTLVRHKREAEIRVLTGKYLMDGIEAAQFKMPALFLSPFSNSNLEAKPDADGRAKDTSDETNAAKGPLAEFFAQAPEDLAAIRKIIPELGRPAEDAERRETFLKLFDLITALKTKANCWDLRPVWQLTSALELLVKRLADKSKEATPSTIRTIASAVDLLGELCVPGVRPDLIINPPISVLAVDDDPLCLRAVTFALQKAEMIPDTAATGERALELAAEKYYDVVFMDIQMPGIDGLDACAQIHKGEKNMTTPVVFVTVRSDFHTRAKSTLVGGTDLLAKPFLMFEITVKALTFAMRKRLSLAASLQREVVSQSGASQIEPAGVPAPPAAVRKPSESAAAPTRDASPAPTHTVMVASTVTSSQKAESTSLVASPVAPERDLHEERMEKKRGKRGKRRDQDKKALVADGSAREDRNAALFIP